MDPDDQKYVPKDQEGFNGILKSYRGHAENEWLDVSRIGLVVSKIHKNWSLYCNKI